MTPLPHVSGPSLILSLTGLAGSQECEFKRRTRFGQDLPSVTEVPFPASGRSRLARCSVFLGTASRFQLERIVHVSPQLSQVEGGDRAMCGGHQFRFARTNTDQWYLIHGVPGTGGAGKTFLSALRDLGQGLFYGG